MGKSDTCVQLFDVICDHSVNNHCSGKMNFLSWCICIEKEKIATDAVYATVLKYINGKKQ